MAIQAISSLSGFDNNGVGLLIQNNAELLNIDGLSNLQGKIPGSIIIADNPKLDNLGGLNAVNEVDGKGTVTGQSITITNNAQLQNVNGLSGITGSLSGSISVTKNAQLTNLVGLESVSSAGSDQSGWSVLVHDNGQLTSLAGLNGLNTISGGVHVSNNTKLQALAMDSLTNMGCSTTKKSIELLFNTEMTEMSGLDSMTGSVCGSLDVQGNIALTNLKAVEGITSFGSDDNGVGVMISGNGALSNVDGLITVTSVGGSFNLLGSAVDSTKKLKGITSVGQDSNGYSLVFGDNSAMKDLGMDGLSGTVPGSVLLFDMPTLNNTDLLKSVTAIGTDSEGVGFVVKNTGISDLTGADALVSVAGGVAFTGNPSMTTISFGAADGVTVGTSSGATQNSIEILDNPALVHTNDFNVMGHLSGGVVVQGNNELTSFLLRAAELGTDANGRCLSIDSNAKLTGITISASTCKGGFAITNNDALVNLEGFVNMAIVKKNSAGNSMEISGNPNLESLHGLEAITQVSGGILVQNNAKLTNLDLRSLHSAGTNNDGRCLEIVNNPALTSLYTDSLTACEGGVTIAQSCLADMTDLSSLQSVGKDKMGKSIALIANSCLKSLHGLGALSSIPGAIEVASNDGLENCDGMALSSMGKDTSGNSVVLVGNPKLTSYDCFGSDLASLPGAIQLIQNGPTSLSGLQYLSTVGANVQGESVVISNHTNLVSGEGLNVQGSVPGSITFESNAVLEILHGLSGVQTIGADADGNSISVMYNNMLNNLTALGACKAVEGAIVLAGNPMLQIIGGLQQLHTISGSNVYGDSLLVTGNAALQNLNSLANLHGHVSGAISIENNAALNTIIGLSNVASVGTNANGDSIFLAENPVLKDVDGFKGLLNKMSGAIIIERNDGLQNLDGFAGVTGITGKNVYNQSLAIVANPQLASVDGMAQMGGAMAGNVQVASNPSLISITGLIEGENAITSAGGLTIDSVRCLSAQDATKLKKLCVNSDCEDKVQNITKCAAESVGTHVLVGQGKGRVCGGVAGPGLQSVSQHKNSQWKSWARYGSSGLYMDVNTAACKFTITPAYVSSIQGDSAHWQLVGVNSIYSSSAKGFRVYIWHPVLRGSFMEFFAKKFKWKINWLADTGKTGGLTTPGNTNWKQYAKDTIYVDVDTTLCGYSSTPAYVPSIHGSSGHWKTVGVHNVYYPTATGFRIYVAHASEVMTAASAEQQKWSISWVGSNDDTYSGHAVSNWNTFCQSGKDCTVSTALYADIDTSKSHLVSPHYVSAVGGESHHLFVTGGASIYRSTSKHFRIYLDKAPTPDVAKAAKWAVNWVAYEEPRDCTVTTWSHWHECDKECAGGSQSRTRKMTIANNAFGACPELDETRPCNTKPCAVHCEVTSWNAWEECQVTCGLGVQIRERDIKTNSKNGGLSCPELRQTVSCNAGPCPIHCEVSMWGTWGKCDKQCGTGTKSRKRTILTQASINGTVCPDLEQESQCVEKQCPQDCVVESWSLWDSCTVTCNKGIQTRSRSVANASKYNGKPCPNLEQTTVCDRGPCPVNCWVSPWSAYSECSKTCGQGNWTRTRTILRKATLTGTVCPHLTETDFCREDSCPVDCEFESWSTWSACTKSCGAGTRERSRKVNTYPQFGGKKCPITLNMEICNSFACPVDCTTQNWDGWSDCSRSCGAGGFRHRKRSIAVEALNGGAACPVLAQRESCTLGPCPIHCVVGPFGAYSDCPVSCGGGSSTRTRRIIRSRGHSGDACPNLQEVVSCNTNACPQDCMVSSWSSWAPEHNASLPYNDGTSKTFSLNGRLVRRRQITQNPLHGGQRCPPLVEHEDHLGKSCTEHSVFGKWSGCTKECGVGYQYRYKERLTCAAKAVVKYHLRMRQGRHCNLHKCAPGVVPQTKEVVVPAIEAVHGLGAGYPDAQN
jgi:hypothetical protein